MLDLQTVCTQLVRTSRALAGALRHAQPLVTSSQPEGSASPIGIRQLKMHDGADWTAGRAVMVYSEAVMLPLAAGVPLLVVVTLAGVEAAVVMDIWARARLEKTRCDQGFMTAQFAMRSQRQKKLTKNERCCESDLRLYRHNRLHDQRPDMTAVYGKLSSSPTCRPKSSMDSPSTHVWNAAHGG